jgi:hypothetical protein
MFLVSILICLSIGLGSAYYLERKLSKFINGTFQKIVFWFGIATFGFGFSSALNVFSTNLTLGLSINYNHLLTYIVVDMVFVPLFCLSLIFLAKLLSKKNSAESLAESVKPENDVNLIQDVCWSNALEELNSGNLDNATWARVYAESNGDEAKSKASYLRYRAQYFQSNLPDENSNTTITSMAVDKLDLQKVEVLPNETSSRNPKFLRYLVKGIKFYLIICVVLFLCVNVYEWIKSS